MGCERGSGCGEGECARNRRRGRQAHYRYCCNKPSNNSDKYEREAGVTNVSLSYDYLARSWLAHSPVCWFALRLPNGLLLPRRGEGWFLYRFFHEEMSRSRKMISPILENEERHLSFPAKQTCTDIAPRYFHIQPL